MQIKIGKYYEDENENIGKCLCTQLLYKNFLVEFYDPISSTYNVVVYDTEGNYKGSNSKYTDLIKEVSSPVEIAPSTYGIAEHVLKELHSKLPTSNYIKDMIAQEQICRKTSTEHLQHTKYKETLASKKDKPSIYDEHYSKFEEDFKMENMAKSLQIKQNKLYKLRGGSKAFISHQCKLSKYWYGIVENDTGIMLWEEDGTIKLSCSKNNAFDIVSEWED
ncbi:MAG: hypothetical protein U9O94_06230 [Nanoarchaeota archaeon]|nr:hypothetical protein [Nanoarchaeota archaeon]